MQALILEAEERDGGPERIAAASHFYEVTIASVDPPKLLSRLSEALVSVAQCCPKLVCESFGVSLYC